MLPNKLLETVDNIRSHIFPNGEKPYRAGKILWIIRQYIKYAYLAALHGYPVGPYTGDKFKVVHKKWDYAPSILKKRLSFSNKLGEYEFNLIFRSKMLKKYGYRFLPDMRWRRELKRIIETDVVYDLISEQ